jgi:TPR repeat protein
VIPDADQEADKIYFLALEMRNSDNNVQAFTHFNKAASLGHVLAMGAVGRAYFLAEGIEENHTIGLSWLINAADLALPQAIKRVEYFKVNEPALYQAALTLAKQNK